MTSRITLTRDGHRVEVKVGDVVPMKCVEGRVELIKTATPGFGYEGEIAFIRLGNGEKAPVRWYQADGDSYHTHPTSIDIAALASRASAPDRIEALVRRLKDRVDTRLNNRLVDMKEGWDDSIVGFNDAWDIVREEFAAALAALGEDES